jgi:signal peptidase II
MQNRWLPGAVSFFGGCIRRADVAVSTQHASKTEQGWYAAGSGRWLGLAAGVAVAVILLDAATKWLVVREIGPNAARTSLGILGSFVELRYTANAGVAFGLLNDSSTIAGALVGIVIVPLVIVLVILSARGLPWAIASGLVLGGAAGNLIDRIGDSTVTDFVSVGRWPSFNVADASITIGALILIGLSLLQNRAESRPNPSESR